MKLKAIIASLFIFIAGVSHGQQPQTSNAPLYQANAKWANGVAPGYWPTAGSGLTLNVSSGTANCGSGVLNTYGGGTLTMSASTTNYVYLNTSANCAPAVKTSNFVAVDIPIAVVSTSGSAITNIFDQRTMFNVLQANGIVPNPVSNQTVMQPSTAGVQTLLTVNAFNNVANVSAYPGADIGAKMAAAQSAWANSNGVMFEITAPGTLSTQINLAAGQALEIEAPITQSAAIFMTSNNLVECKGAPALISLTVPTTVFAIQGNGTNDRITGCNVLASTAAAGSSFLGNTPAASTLSNVSVDHNTVTGQVNGWIIGNGTTISFSSFTDNTFISTGSVTQVWETGGYTSYMNVSGNKCQGVQDCIADESTVNASTDPNLATIIAAGNAYNIFSGNSCESVVSCVFIAVGYNSVISGNTSTGAVDTAFDFEGSAGINVAGNTCYAVLGGQECVSQFFTGFNNRVTGNHIYLANSPDGGILVHNASANPALATGLTITENDITCQGPTYPCAGIVFDAGTNVTLSNNVLVDSIIEYPSVEQPGMMLSHNRLTYTGSSEVSVGLQLPSPLNELPVVAEGNTIITYAAQNAGSYCISGVAGDSNNSNIYYIKDNHCWGEDGAANFSGGDIHLTYNGTNSGIGAYYTIENNDTQSNTFTFDGSNTNIHTIRNANCPLMSTCVSDSLTVTGIAALGPGSTRNGSLICAADGVNCPSGSFSSLTGGTNTTAAMVVGTGASFAYSGSGSINASQLLGASWASPSAIGGTTPAAGSFTSLSSTSSAVNGNLNMTYNGTTSTNMGLAQCPSISLGGYCAWTLGYNSSAGNFIQMGFNHNTNSIGYLYTGAVPLILVSSAYTGTSNSLAVSNSSSSSSIGFSCASGVALCVAPSSNTAAPFTVSTAGVASTAASPVSNNNSTVPTTADVNAALAPYAPLASPALTGTPTAPTVSASLNNTQLCTTACVETAVAGVVSFTDAYWSIAPTLFTLSTMLGPTHYTNYVGAVSTITARLSGTISCSVAPVIQLMDLGTSPTTVYSSATAIATITTGTSDGVYTGEVSDELIAGHYYGVAFSSGTCVTAPTFDISAWAPW